MSEDDQHLRRAIRLAMNGRGKVEPNPMVGCVIVKNHQIIGEGFHPQYGHPHAEPEALAACTESPEGATAYVTLEPCCHTNKQTPPCAPRLIEAKITRVVVGCLDPNPDVNGKGVQMLRDAGIAVEGSPLEAECKQLIAPFLARINQNWPYVTMKWAETADKKIAAAGGRQIQISNSCSTRLVHILRSRSDAICVGINTVLTDNPNLTPRNVALLRPIHRFVLDSKLRIPMDSQLVQTARNTLTTVFCFPSEVDSPQADQLRARGVNVIDLDPRQLATYRPDRRLSLTEMFLSIDGAHLLVEPGPTLARGFFDQNAADRLWVIRSPKILGDSTAPSSATIPDYFVKTGEINLAGDVLSEFLNTKSQVYYAPAPSADLVTGVAASAATGAG